MSNNNSGPKNSKIISLFITFAILFVIVFGLGVIIGKGLGGPDTNIVQKSYDIEAPEVEYGASDEIASEKIAPLEMESEVVVLDEDVLDEDAESSVDKDSKEATADTDSTESQSKDTPQIETPSQTPQPEKMTDKSEVDSKEMVKEKESPKVNVEKTPATEQTPDKSTMPKIDPSGRYTVQIGAFQNQTEANKLMNSLKSNGYPAFLKPVQTPDKKTWYRVRVGTFSTKSEAVDYGDKLKQRASGVKSVFITVNN